MFFQSLIENNIEWVLRLMVLIGIYVRYLYHEHELSDPNQFNIGFGILLLYLLLIAHQEFRNRIKKKTSGYRSDHRSWYITQACFDLLIFSYFYLLTGEANSDFFLFYFLPLLFTAEKLNTKWALIIFLAVSTSATGVIFFLSSDNSVSATLVRVVLPRVVFFFFIVYIVSIRNMIARQRTRRLQLVSDIVKKIGREISEEKILQVIADECHKSFDAIGVHLRLRDGDKLRIVAKSGRFTNIVSEEDSTIPQTDVVGKKLPNFMKAFLQGRPQIVDNASKDYHFDKLTKSIDDPLKAEFLGTIKGFGCFPLLFDNQSVGVLTIRASKKNYFTREIIEDAEELTNSIATIIRNYNVQHVLVQASWNINQQQDSEARLNRIVAHASQILGGTGGKVYLLDTSRDKLVLAAIEGIKNSPRPVPQVGDTLDFSEGMVGQVIKNKKPIIVNDYASYPYRIDRFKSLIKSLVEVPLIDTEGEIIGAIGVFNNSNNGNTFSKERDIPLLEQFAEHATLALQNIRLLERERLLRQLSSRISSTFEISDITRDTLDYLSKVIYFDSASIQLLYGNYLSIVDCTGFDENEAAAVRTFRFLVTPDRPNYEVVIGESKGQIKILADLPKLFPKTSDAPGLKDVYYWMGIPLIIDGDVIGMITLDRKKQRTSFSEADASLIAAFASHVAIALRNVRQIHTLRNFQKTMEVLFDANEVAKAELQVEVSLQKIAEQAWRLTQKPSTRETGFSHITLITGNVVQYVATYPQTRLGELVNKGLTAINLEEQRHRYGIVSRVVKTLKTQNVPDVTLDDDFIDIDSNCCSQISVPISIGNTLLGIISVLHPEKDFFTSDDAAALGFLAKNAAAVIKLSRLLSVQYGLTAFTVPILHMHHEIRSLLTNAATRLWSVLNSDTDMVSVQTKVRQSLDELMKIPLDSSTLPPSITIGMELTNLVPLVRNTLEHNENFRQIPEVNKVVDTSTDYVVECNPLWFAYAINIILDNAANAMEHKALHERKVSFRFSRVSTNVEIEIENNGERILNEILKDVFRKPISKANQPNRLSLGAFIVGQIIEVYNGRIDVKSTTDERTIISILLPLHT